MNISSKKKLAVPRPLAISTSNATQLQRSLDKIQAKSTADILNAGDVIGLAEKAELRLHGISINKRDRTGAKFTVTPAGPECRAYKYSRLGTAVELQRRSRGWVLAQATRVVTYPCQPKKESLKLTDKQKVNLLQKIMVRWSISSAIASLAINGIST